MNETTIHATEPDDPSDLLWPPTLAPYLAEATRAGRFQLWQPVD